MSEKLNSALKEPTPTQGEGYDPNHPCRGRSEIIDADRGIVMNYGPDGEPRKKIAICGFASSSRWAVPVDDPDWDIWLLNQLGRHVRRGDRTFDIHRAWNAELVPGTEGDGPESYRGFFRACGIPVFLIEREPDIQTSVRFPIERLIEKFGVDYFTSTIAFMTALAIDEIDAAVEQRMRQAPPNGLASAWDVHELARSIYNEYTIGIFGVDLVVGDEYFWQKACAEFWIGTALSRNIEVMLPPQSALCKQQFRYGYESEPPTIIKPNEIAKHKAEMTTQRDEGLKKLYMLEGVLQAVAEPPADANAVRRERDEHLKRMLMIEGVIEADTHWADLLELRLRGADVKT